jgi:aspartate aminotransferase
LISKEIGELMESGSAIRKAWDHGRILSRSHGAEAVADMTLGNPVAPPPQPLLEALRKVVEDPPAGLHRYTAHAGIRDVRERVADHLNQRALLPGVKGDHVLMTAGASAASNIVLRALLNPGDEVIFLSPYFPDYPAHVMNHGGLPLAVPTEPDFLPDLGKIESALGPKTRVVILNHPNNPSGRQYPVGLLEELAGLLRNAGRRCGKPIYLLSDEPYREIRFTDEPFVSPARVYENGIMTYSFSKSHSIPGERIGYIALNPEGQGTEELVAAMSLSARILGFPNAPSLWQVVISRCLEAVVDVEPLRRYRDRLYSALLDKGYDVVEPDLFPRVPGGDEELFVRDLTNKLLLVVPGETFGCPGYFRIATCVDERTVELAVERLPAAGG